ncbi:hypothetical protein UAJ10_07155 [Nitrospirillum sp. BR 11164]|uniref:hypothetical protein n=1 Tax=Nitrospirillum sp. BR 11164 TaxID=3104324 RepID=UPI002AFEE4FD|nr:hypothetical protein [Nitrospirillum sp. BR 11164]MEA1648792.1 hypothetical protein [Nitrospirillum sp. BR 11164]
MSELSISQRLVIGALVDRIVFGEEDVFSSRDAAELHRLLPATGIAKFSFEGTFSGPASQGGFAAGVGDVQLDGEKQVRVKAGGGREVRAGQWRLSCNRRCIQIVQVMGDDGNEGRACLLRFHRDGRPRDLMGRVTRALHIPWTPISVAFGTWAYWKAPVTH